jgi:ABC-type branched-subunit amino acid transport system substrate-binding protein
MSVVSMTAANAATATPVPGVTRSAITVGGVVTGDAGSIGADIGAQARFARANARGGVAGRRIQYSGTSPDAASVVAAGSVFAVVPAVSPTLDTYALAQAGIPFFGAASTPGWNANRFGFGFVGAQAALQTRVVDPSWGMLLRSLLGTARGLRVALVVDADALGDARAAQARASLRAAGFPVAAPVTLPAPPATLPDLVPIVTTLTSTAPAAVLLLTSPVTTAALARQLTVAGFTGTVATGGASYLPTAPALADGLTVLVPYAPFEQTTTANRRLAADVEAFKPGTALTPGVAAGYWSADAFLAAVRRTGQRLTRARFLAAANHGFAFAVPGTVGRSTWPAMHSLPVPCGALVQSDGSRVLVVERYRCGTPIVRKARAR